MLSQEIQRQCCHPVANRIIAQVPKHSLTAVPLEPRGQVPWPTLTNVSSKKMYNNYRVLSPNVNIEKNFIIYGVLIEIYTESVKKRNEYVK